MPDDEKPARRKRKPEVELCPQCWPDGWPTPDTNGASCEHGAYKR